MRLAMLAHRFGYFIFLIHIDFQVSIKYHCQEYKKSFILHQESCFCFSKILIYDFIFSILISFPPPLIQQIPHSLDSSLDSFLMLMNLNTISYISFCIYKKKKIILCHLGDFVGRFVNLLDALRQ